MRGSIVVDSLVIQRSAHFVGDAHYETLTVEQGARVEGTFATGGGERPATKALAPIAAVPSADAPPLRGEGEAEQATNG